MEVQEEDEAVNLVYDLFVSFLLSLIYTTFVARRRYGLVEVATKIVML